MNSLKIGAWLLCLFISMSVFGQKSPSKNGKIDIENLNSTVCPIDSNASAYYIFDFGNTYFEYADTKVSSNSTYNSNKGFQLFYTRHFRIKVVNKEGLSFGDIRIPLYHDSENNKEELISIKASSYNLVDGKIERTKVDRKDVLIEETSSRISTAKIAMPAVKEGSIIEVEYMIKSDFLYNLQTWKIQYPIPNLFSEYYVAIPEYFKYNQTHRGFYTINLEKTERSQQITITYKQEAEGVAVAPQSYTNTIDYSEVTYHYTAENILGFPNEPYLRTASNYLSRVEFELEKTQFPYSREHYYTTTWDEVDKKLIESSYFGKELENDKHIESIASMLKPSYTDSLALLDDALKLIKQRIIWNGGYNKYVTESLKKAFNDGSGNCADVNLNLVLLLRQRGITSYPVILSTQQNGIIHPSHPSISRFNYVIAMAMVGDKTYLLDATDPSSEINLIPIRCLNDKGRIIGDVKEKWINLMDYKSLTEVFQYQLTLDEDAVITGNVTKKYVDYGAYNMRKEIGESNSAEAFIESKKGKDGKLRIANVTIDSLKSVNTPLVINYDVTDTKLANKSGDMIYFSPSINPYFSKNPFKLEKREFPVEFNHPYLIQQSYTYIIPDSYEVKELPKPLIANLADRSGKIIFQVSQNGNNIMVNSLMIIKRSLYLPSEYENLKGLIQLLIDKQNEMIVLKKR